ncbi:hypothetical protein [Stigmatella aurantiaca]|uniref:hypothetical protein n=1 Tax=Stigmatella aurantiaca TaxID=41 RepID=UPI0002D7382C|nr:hypothetical protein [Stigmatella aurantiaca]
MGCTFRLQVQEDSILHPYAPPELNVRWPVYHIVMRRDVDPSNPCIIPVAGTRELGISFYEPSIALTSTGRGIVAAYSATAVAPWYGGSSILSLGQLNPSSLDFMRAEGLRGHHSSPGVRGEVTLHEVIIHPGYLEVTGFLTGNAVSATSSSNPPYPVQEGSRFVALYPDFFGPERRPPVFSIYN